MDGKLQLRVQRHRSRSYKLCRQRHLKFSKMPGIQVEAGLPHGAESRDRAFCLDWVEAIMEIENNKHRAGAHLGARMLA